MNPFPSTEAELGKRKKVPAAMRRYLEAAELRKEAPAGGDVHVDSPVWGTPRKKKRKRSPFKSNIRIVRKARGRHPFDERLEKELALQLRRHFEFMVVPPEAAIAKAVETGDAEPLIAAMDLPGWERRMANALYDQLIVAAWTESQAAHVSKAAVVVRSPAVLAWARRRSSELVVDISSYARENIRKVITRTYREGLGVRKAVPLVRKALGVRRALFPRWADAVENYEAKLLADGVSAARAAEQAGRYRDKLVTARSRMIARTEVLGAQNEGRLAAWEEMVKNGTISVEGVAKQWDATWEGVCPECDALDGTETDLFGVFDGGYLRPPAHPNCRCVVQLVRRG